MSDTPSICAQGLNVGFFCFGKAEQPGVNYFNCGLVARPDGEWLVTRRSVFDKHIRIGRNDVVAFKLDERHEPSVGVKVKLTKTFEGEHFEDPRAIFYQGRTYVSCCNFVWSGRSWSGAHQMISAVNKQWDAVERFDPIYGNNGPGVGAERGHEKNWLWFFHDDAPHLVYQASPHTVARFSSNFRFKNEYRSPLPFQWRYGEIRGGTPPVLVDGEYWTFFHSSTEWQPPFRQYHLGAYAFEAEPPFKITRITNRPLLSGSQKDQWAKGKPIVVFACGSKYNDGQWFITGGCNDLCCFWAELGHDELLRRTRARGPIGLLCDKLLYA